MASAKSAKSLLEGAFTDVPPSAQAPEYKSLVDGGALHILSGITAVEFHVPGKISSEAGGLSPFPYPILKKANGVEYWFISGELSGYFTDEFGQHVVVGPVDLNGVSHRSETFDPDDPQVEDSVSHPRAGLPGAFFALSMPVKGFNQGLVQIEPAGDGGTFFPAAPLLWNPVDPIALLERGYAVFTFGQGGTVPADFSRTVDTNPDSGSDIFWKDPPEEVVSYARYSFFNEETEEEATLTSDFALTFFDGFWVTIPFGDPEFFFGSLHTYPEIISDTVVFAKNLVRYSFPRREVHWAAYVGWSGSGRAAVLINSNTRFGSFQAPKSVGPEVGGGDYNVWGEPASGLRYDAFVSYAGSNDSQGYFDQSLFGNFPTDVNPELPASAPFVWFVPEYDVVAYQYNAYAYANKIWKALERLGRGSKVNDFIRIYSLPKATHQSRDQRFAAFDSRDRKDGLWFEYLDSFPNPGAFNEERRGYRISGPNAELLRVNPPADGWNFDFQGAAKLPRQTPLWLQTFTNLRLYSERGVPLPTSRVDARIFNNIEEVTTATELPPYPREDIPFPESDEELFALVNSRSHTVQEDTGLRVIFPWEELRPLNLSELEVEELKLFARENPLKRSTKPLLLPDVAAPLGGPGLYFFDSLYQRFFTEKEFRARYHNHFGYVLAFSGATFDLMAGRLWDPKLGLSQIGEAAVNKVKLRPE